MTLQFRACYTGRLGKTGKPCVKKSPLVDTHGLSIETINDDNHNDDDILNESSKHNQAKARIIRSV